MKSAWALRDKSSHSNCTIFAYPVQRNQRRPGSFLPPHTVYLSDSEAKRLAATLRRCADLLDGSADKGSGNLDAYEICPLEGTAEAAAEYIREHPGALGKQIARALGISYEHFRGPVFAKLKQHSFYNSRGYRPPK